MVESAQLGVYVCIFSLLALATVAIVLRFVARRLKGVWLWYDDYLAVFAYVSSPKTPPSPTNCVSFEEGCLY